MQFPVPKRIALFFSLAALALVAVVVFAVPVSARPGSSPPVQSLPTRRKPTATKRSSGSDRPASTPVPTATLPPTSTPTPVLPPTSTPTPTPTPTPTSISITDIESREGGIVLPTSGQIRLTFGQLGYSAVALNRDAPDRQYSVDLPGNFQISSAGNSLDLITSHFPLSPDKPTALEIQINGRLVYAFALTETNAISNRVHIDLPPGVLHSGPNPIALHLNTSATCEEPGAVVNAVISENSTLSFGYRQIPYPTDLSRYPLPFAETSLLSVPVTIILPDAPSAKDLAAAMTIAAGLGRSSGGEIDLHAIQAKEFDPDIYGYHHLIVMGQPDDNALLSELELAVPVDDSIEPGQGVLETFVSPWNEFRLALVVTGLDNRGISRASHALNQEASRAGMRGPTAIVTEFRPEDSLAVPTIRTVRPTATTLAALGYDDQTAYGAALQSFGYEFELPRGWQLDGAAGFVLRFSHAVILDPGGSILNVELNGRPIGSTLLNESNATGGELALSLPAPLLQTGSNRLEIGIEMNLPNRDRCQALTDERAWTLISSESQLSVPYSVAHLAPDLGTFPRPFSQASGLDKTVFVPPDPPSETMIDDLIQLAVRLGTPAATDYLPVHVIYAVEGAWTGGVQGLWQDRHTILLGRPTENVVLGELNSELLQPFVDGSDVLGPLAVENVAFRPDHSGDLGILQTTYSPWNAQYTLLVVSGTSDEGVHLAVKSLSDPAQSLEGNLVFIEPATASTSGGLGRISTYSVDVQPPVPVEGQATPGSGNAGPETTPTAPTRRQILLAERWW